MKTKTNKWVVEQLELLLMDILLKSENPVKRYPLGQLKLRIGEFIDKLITQTQQETLEWCLKEAVPKAEREFHGPVDLTGILDKDDLCQIIKNKMEETK